MRETVNTYVYCQGRNLEAEKHYGEALLIFKAMKKDDYFFRAAPNLANVYFSLGCQADAELVLRACLEHYKAKNDVDEYTGNLETMASNYSYGSFHKICNQMALT